MVILFDEGSEGETMPVLFLPRSVSPPGAIMNRFLTRTTITLRGRLGQSKLLPSKGTVKTRVKDLGKAIVNLRLIDQGDPIGEDLLIDDLWRQGNSPFTVL